MHGTGRRITAHAAPERVVGVAPPASRCRPAPPWGRPWPSLSQRARCGCPRSPRCSTPSWRMARRRQPISPSAPLSQMWAWSPSPIRAWTSCPPSPRASRRCAQASHLPHNVGACSRRSSSWVASCWEAATVLLVPTAPRRCPHLHPTPASRRLPPPPPPRPRPPGAHHRGVCGHCRPGARCKPGRGLGQQVPGQHSGN